MVDCLEMDVILPLEVGNCAICTELAASKDIRFFVVRTVYNFPAAINTIGFSFDDRLGLWDQSIGEMA